VARGAARGARLPRVGDGTPAPLSRTALRTSVANARGGGKSSRDRMCPSWPIAAGAVAPVRIARSPFQKPEAQWLPTAAMWHAGPREMKNGMSHLSVSAISGHAACELPRRCPSTGRAKATDFAM